MRNLLISSKYPPEYAGSGLRAHNTYQRLQRKFDIAFDVITSSVTHNTSQSYVYDNIQVKRIAQKRYLPFHRNKNLKGVKRIFQGLKYRWVFQNNYWPEALKTVRHLSKVSHKYDLFHVFGNSAVTAAAITYAKAIKKPLIVELVNWSKHPAHYEPHFMANLLGKGYPPNALIVCLSEQLRKACLKQGYSEQQIWCRPNPIDEKRFTPIGPNALRHPFDHKDIIVLHLAKFIPRKKQDFMIQVLAKLPEKYKLILAGPIVQDGPLKLRDQAYLEGIKKSATQQGVSKRLHIIPHFIETPETWMRMANVFVLPSIDEAFGTPFMEAIACGTPSIVNNLSQVYDMWVEPGKNGFICDLIPELWASKIQEASNFSQMQRLQASKKILQRASTQTIDAAYQTHLNALCSNANQSTTVHIS